MLPLCTSVTDGRQCLMAKRIRHLDETLGAERRHRLDADRRLFADLLAELVLDESAQLFGFRRARLPFDARVDVLGVLAKDDDVELLGLLHRAADALEIAHRADARVQVEHLAQRHVERANAAADRRGERALDRDAEFLHGVDGFLREPVLELRERLFAGEHLHPRDLAARRR